MYQGFRQIATCQVGQARYFPHVDVFFSLTLAGDSRFLRHWLLVLSFLRRWLLTSSFIRRLGGPGGPVRVRQLVAHGSLAVCPEVGPSALFALQRKREYTIARRGGLVG